MMTQTFELTQTCGHLPVRIILVLACTQSRRLLSRITLRRLKHMIRTARARQTFPVRACTGRCHNRDRSDAGKGPGRFYHKNPAESLILFRLGSSKDRRVLRHHVKSIPAADREFDMLDIRLRIGKNA